MAHCTCKCKSSLVAHPTSETVFLGLNLLLSTNDPGVQQDQCEKTISHGKEGENMF